MASHVQTTSHPFYFILPTATTVAIVHPAIIDELSTTCALQRKCQPPELFLLNLQKPRNGGSSDLQNAHGGK